MRIIEKPADEEIDRLLRKYRRIRRRVVDWDMPQLDPARDYPPCFGEVVLLIIDDVGRIAAMRKRGASEEAYMLPQGRIDEGEGIEDAAVREAFEETGREVKVEEVAAVHRVRIRFKSWRLERWHFVMICRSTSGGGKPQDQDEVAEIKFLKIPSEIPTEWIRSGWELSVLKDAGLLHPHSFLLGKPSS